MIKVIVGVIIAAGIALAIVYVSGGYSRLDPTKEGKQAKAAVKAGMTPAQVIAAAGAPQRYQINRKVTKSVNGQKIEVVEPGPELKFDQQLFTNDLAANQMPEGFIFDYMFSYQAAFSVAFDSAALVESVQDTKTMADLLDTRGGG